MLGATAYVPQYMILRFELTKDSSLLRSKLARFHQARQYTAAPASCSLLWRRAIRLHPAPGHDLPLDDSVYATSQGVA